MRMILFVVLLAASYPAHAAFNLGKVREGIREGIGNLDKDIGNCFQGGCDVFWILNQRIDDGIQSKANSLVGPARDAFIQVMDDLFKNKLNSFLDKVNDDASGRIDQASDRADKIVNETITGVLHIIDATGDLIENASAELQKAILLGSQEANNLVDKINKDAINLVDKINRDLSELIEDIDCKGIGIVEVVKDFVTELTAFPRPWDHCYTDLGYWFSVPSSNDPLNWYRINKCLLIRDVDNSKTVYDIRFNYARLSLWARRMKCIAQNQLATQIADEDSKTYAKSFEMWFLASR